LNQEKFIDRKEELKLLEDFLNSENKYFAIIYGRRRVGKTRLLLELYKKRKIDIFIMFEEADYETNLVKSSEIISKKFDFPYFKPKSFKELFNSLPNGTKIVLDEFSYLKNFGEFQEIVDFILKKRNIKLIVCGSLIKIMEDLSYSINSPLFGRADLIIKLNPLSFLDSIKFFNVKIEESTKIYMALGGIPRYLELVNSFDDVIKQFFTKYGLFLREGKLLLKEIFPKSSLYSKILFSIANNTTEATEIANKIGIKPNEISKYLEILVEYGLVKKEKPFMSKSKKDVRFYLKDNFFSFWHKFVWNFYNEIESGLNENALSYFNNNKNQFFGYKFEDLAKELIIYLNKTKKFPFPIEQLSKWWYKDKEIDLVAFNEQEKKIAFLEAKWQDLKLNDVKRIIKELEEKVEVFYERTKLNKNELKEYFGIVAKKMDEKAKEWLKENEYLAYELKDFDL